MASSNVDSSPPTMLSITTPSFSAPSGYDLSTLPRPTISRPPDVLIEVHAASINPIDVKKASGALKMAVSEEFPYQIGYDCAGVVKEVGKDVKGFKVGDEVYTRLPEANRGSWGEYATCPEDHLALKPASLSFGNAASLPLAAMTALQAFRKYDGSLEGKTVFVPAALSGTGAYACQLAKNVFKAGKVITTVSTAKIPKVPKLLGQGIVDQVIDYTTNSLSTAIPPKSIDFILDTTGAAPSLLSFMTPRTGTIISISTTPSASQLQSADLLRRHPSMPSPQLPVLGALYLDTLDTWRKWRAGRWGVRYEYMFLEASGKDLKKIAEWVEEGKLRPVVGRSVKFGDLAEVKSAAGQVYEGKGGLGKAVILMK